MLSSAMTEVPPTRIEVGGYREEFRVYILTDYNYVFLATCVSLYNIEE